MRTAFHGLSLLCSRRGRRRRGEFQGRPATIPAWEIAIGTTDHSANEARDPPLPHRLIHFIHRPRHAAIFSTKSAQSPRYVACQGAFFTPVTGYTRLSTRGSGALSPGSRADPCDLTLSPYNLRPTCDAWFLHGALFARRDSALTTGQAGFYAVLASNQVG